MGLRCILALACLLMTSGITRVAYVCNLTCLKACYHFSHLIDWGRGICISTRSHLLPVPVQFLLLRAQSNKQHNKIDIVCNAIRAQSNKQHNKIDIVCNAMRAQSNKQHNKIDIVCNAIIHISFRMDGLPRGRTVCGGRRAGSVGEGVGCGVTYKFS